MKKTIVSSLLTIFFISFLSAGNYSHEGMILTSGGGTSVSNSGTHFIVLGEPFVSFEGTSSKSGFLINSTVKSEPSSAGVAIDLDYMTRNYEQDIISSQDIETSETVNANTEKWLAVVAQNVSNLDTYQIEVSYDPNRLQFMLGLEENVMGGINNLLKKNGGSTIGFQAVEKEAGVVNISNALVGTDTAIAPEGTGLIALLKFKVLDNDSNNTLAFKNVYYVNSSGKNEQITNYINGVLNPKEECIQVITPAYNPTTGEEKEFPSPCDVPEGWTVGDVPNFDGDDQNDIVDLDDDNDGISDEDEEKYNLDPKDPSDAEKDSDGDGVSNIDEIKSGTNPNDKNDYPRIGLSQEEKAMFMILLNRSNFLNRDSVQSSSPSMNLPAVFMIEALKNKEESK